MTKRWAWAFAICIAAIAVFFILGMITQNDFIIALFCIALVAACICLVGVLISAICSLVRKHREKYDISPHDIPPRPVVRNAPIKLKADPPKAPVAQKQSERPQNGGNACLLLAVIVGAIFTFLKWFNAISVLQEMGDSFGEWLGVSLGLGVTSPHMLLDLLALVFAIIGFAVNAPWAALVAGILYAVALFAFPMWWYSVLAQMILCFVAYAQMYKNKMAASQPRN